MVDTIRAEAVKRSTMCCWPPGAHVCFSWQWRHAGNCLAVDERARRDNRGLVADGWVTRGFTSTLPDQSFRAIDCISRQQISPGARDAWPRFRRRYITNSCGIRLSRFIIAFWSRPTERRHLLFARDHSYIFVGILLEERYMVDLFGDDYRTLPRSGVDAFCPGASR